MLKDSRKVVASIRDEVIGFFNWPSTTSCNMALGSSKPLTEMSTRNLLGGKGRRALKTGNITAFFEPIVFKGFSACFNSRTHDTPNKALKLSRHVISFVKKRFYN
jgi:hypothetical protein